MEDGVELLRISVLYPLFTDAESGKRAEELSAFYQVIADRAVCFAKERLFSELREQYRELPLRERKFSPSKGKYALMIRASCSSTDPLDVEVTTHASFSCRGIKLQETSDHRVWHIHPKGLILAEKKDKKRKNRNHGKNRA